MEEQAFRIKTLDGSNYASWCSDIKVILLERDCWDIVQGTETAPTEKDGEVDEKKLKDFKLRSNRAYSTIYLNVSPEYRTVIEDTTSGPEAWSILKKHFRPDSRSMVMALKHEFFCTMPEPGEKLGLFASRLSRLIGQLKDAGHPVEDIDQCFQLLRFLPSEFEGIIQTVYRWDDENFKFPKVLGEILAEEARLKQRATDQAACVMMTHSTNSQLADSSKEFRNAPERFLTSSPAEFPRRNRQFTARATSKSNPKRRAKEGCSSYLLEALTCDTSKECWIFDSAASTHFCRNKETF